MNILVIGGSYFFGRWFVTLAAKKHNVTVLNRGNIPFKAEGINEIVADRHKPESFPKVKERYDCIVDFCAYQSEDIQTIATHFGGVSTRYIFISTVDVYEKGSEKPLSESAPLESRKYPGEVGAYIEGKVCLERELLDVSERLGMIPVSVRPGILFGPANYAPREKMYFDWIEQAGQIIAPLDATGFFQFIYVKDAALGLLKLCELSEKEILPAYNFCNDEICDYNAFHSALREASDKEFSLVPLKVEEIINRGIPLPFPLTREESEHYCSDRFKSLGVEFTPLSKGLAECR